MLKYIVERKVFRHAAKVFLPLITVVILNPVSPAFPTDIKLSGGMKVSYEKFDRGYEKNAGSDQARIGQERSDDETVLQVKSNSSKVDDQYDRFRLSPSLELTSVSARNDIALFYSPSFRYDDQTSDHDVDHDLQASIKRLLTKDWRVFLTENYQLTDRVYDQRSQGSDSVMKISDNSSRRMYWTNSVSLVSEYSYWEKSVFSTGYNYNILRNSVGIDQDDYTDYQRHEVQLSLGHQYSAMWKINVASSYVRGLFDDDREELGGASGGYRDNDLNEFRASTKLESALVDHHPQSLSYRYDTVIYDDESLGKGAVHDLIYGWQWLISKDWNTSLGGGPSCVDKEGENLTWGYNANISLQHSFESGSLTFIANSGFEWRNFSGTNENGLNEFWQSRLDFKYELSREVAWRLFSAYRYEDQEVITPHLFGSSLSGETAGVSEGTEKTETFNRQRFSVGTVMEWKFWKLYTAGFSYDYVAQDSELPDDSYDEHRVMLSLSIKTEMFSW